MNAPTVLAESARKNSCHHERHMSGIGLKVYNLFWRLSKKSKTCSIAITNQRIAKLIGARAGKRGDHITRVKTALVRDGWLEFQGVSKGSKTGTWGGGRYSFGTATLNSSGLATLTRSLESAGSYQLTAVYSGDANNLGSASVALNQIVTQATSSAALTSSPNPSTLEQPVTFTAQISSPTVTATGPVTFTAGKTVLGTAQLSGGKAKFTTSTLTVGSTKVTATYQGDSNIAGASASVRQTVQP